MAAKSTVLANTGVRQVEELLIWGGTALLLGIVVLAILATLGSGRHQ